MGATGPTGPTRSVSQLPPATYNDPTNPNRITTVVLRGDDNVLDWSDVEDALADVSRAIERLDKAVLDDDNAHKAALAAARELEAAKSAVRDAQTRWHNANNAIYDQVVPQMGEVQR